MKYLVLSWFILYHMVTLSMATPKSLFPDEKDIKSQDNSLSSAVTQFENIIETSSGGSIDSLNSNTEYNQQRILELQEQLQVKREYLQKLPDLASRQFETMLAQYPINGGAKLSHLAGG